MFMKHSGIIDGLGQTIIVEEAQATFDAIYAPRGWVTATQGEADAYFGAPNPDDTLVTKVQLDTAIAGSVGSLVARSSTPSTITYNTDGTVNTVTESDTGAVTTYTYNADGTPATESRVLGGVTTTRTFTYTSGNLVSVA